MAVTNYYVQLASHASLYAGWERVAANDGAPGVDGISVNKFDVQSERHLERLYTELATFTYRCLPLRRYEIPKSSGKLRLLAVPAVRDRVVQAAALHVLQAIVERELERCSFAYRPGLSRLTAFEHIRQHYNDGYRWVVDADIESFFDNVEFDLLLQRFSELIPESKTIALIEQWIKAPVLVQGKLLKRSKGLLQGSPVSPMLANLFLDKFDERLLAKNHKLIRYADDFIILCKSKPRAEEALKLTEGILAEMNLRLHPEKTAITTFEQGFKYLGAVFLRSMIVPSQKQKAPKNQKRKAKSTMPNTKPEREQKQPSQPPKPKATRRKRFAQTPPPNSAIADALQEALQEKNMSIAELTRPVEEPGTPVLVASGAATETTGERPSLPELSAEQHIPALSQGTSPFMRTLYIQEQGCWLKYNNEQFIISTGGEEGVPLTKIPTAKVRQVFIFGSCLITPAAIRHCLMNAIPITLLSSRGQYFGRIESTEPVDIALERQQFSRSADPSFLLDTSKRIVHAKLLNTRAFLQRYHQKLQKPVVASAIDELTAMGEAVGYCATIDEVRGHEGHGSAVFFDVYDELFTAEGFVFAKRVRRPPTDPVNAMLSFGYALLFNNIFSMARLHRLNPYVGSLHADKANHPALISDLIEEFRWSIEALVLGLINKRIMTPEDFSIQEAEKPRQSDEDAARPKPCLLSDDARKRFIGEFELLMNRSVKHPGTGYTTSYRRCLDLQVQAYARHIRGEAMYEPFRKVVPASTSRLGVWDSGRSDVRTVSEGMVTLSL